jgi:hypothetical protein
MTTAASTAATLVARVVREAAAAASSVSLVAVKAAALERLKQVSPAAHGHAERLLRHQEAQLALTRLRERMERDAAARQLMAPAYARLSDAEQRLAAGMRLQPLSLGSREYEAWQVQVAALQRAVDEERSRCALEEQSSETLAAIRSLNELDAHSETYRLFATSLHYGYFVAVGLLYVLWCIYHTLLWALSRVPAQRRDIKRVRDELAAVSSSVEALRADVAAAVTAIQLLSSVVGNSEAPAAAVHPQAVARSDAASQTVALASDSARAVIAVPSLSDVATALLALPRRAHAALEELGVAFMTFLAALLRAAFGTPLPRENVHLT